MRGVISIFLKSVVVYSFLYLFIASNTIAQNEVNVEIKTNNLTGRIRALNGGTLSPVCNLKLLDLSGEFKELAIPFVRLHDAPWINDNVVDIHTIFRDFRLDPKDETNYDFRKTDDYIKSILETGTKIVFRLGESIEHTDKRYWVNPPSDFKKWAQICCGIIRHYNGGWANGFFYNIKYWEIWNEPDCRPKMWTGTDKEFLDFFETAAKTIKAEFPNVMVGGPAFSNPLVFMDGRYEPSPMVTGFMENCKEKSIPLDFFSWHSYSYDPWLTVFRTTLVRRLLDKYGFEGTESHMNEWNYIPGEKWHLFQDEKYQGKERSKIYAEQYGCKGATYIANVLMLLQDSPVDQANYYTTTAGLFGIFSEYGEPHKSFYAFKAFSELLKTPLRVEINYATDDSIVVCAGISEDKSKLTILASNFTTENKKVNFKLLDNWETESVNVEVSVVDRMNDLETVNSYSFQGRLQGLSEFLPSETILLIVLTSIN